MPMTQRGISLIEVIVMLLLLGILGVTVLPRFSDKAVLDARGFHDATLAALRHAQKTAIAERRVVCVSFTADSLSLKLATGAGSSVCDADLPLPGQATPLLQANHAAYVSIPTNFSFNPLGAASLAQTLKVSGTGPSIRVEAGTGYAHEI